MHFFKFSQQLTSIACDNLHGSSVTSATGGTNTGLASIYSDDDDFLPPAPVKKRRKRKLLLSDEVDRYRATYMLAI